MNKYIFSLLLAITFSLNAGGQTKSKIKIDWLYLPMGVFTMGSPLEQAKGQVAEVPHQVTLTGFKMSKYEITNAQYAAFLNANKIGSDGKYAAGAYPTQVLIYESNGEHDWGLHFVNGKWVPVAGYENNPVIRVTWYGASEFAAYIGCRLPTEAEWEYACRAGTNTHFNTGSCLSATQANYNGNIPMEGCSEGVNKGKTMPVGSFAPNAWGLYDMHGNVYEWCSDWYETYSSDAQLNPKGPESGKWRVYRGGSWASIALFCQCAYRNNSEPEDSGYTIGFRVVSDNK